MAFIVTTISNDFNLQDLGGEVLVHPITRDLELSYPIEELRESQTIQEGITNGDITVNYEGNNIVTLSTLRLITSSELSTLQTNSHTHTNKAILDSITNIGSGIIISTTERSKLSGIQAGAQVNRTPAQLKTDYESNANTNAFTDAEKASVVLNTSSRHTHSNKAVLDSIANAGSGSIITAAERVAYNNKINSIQSGDSISVDNTTPLSPIVNLDIKKIVIDLSSSQSINTTSAVVIDFSTIVENSIVGASVSAGTVTLPIGEYKMSYVVNGVMGGGNTRANVAMLAFKGAGGGGGLIGASVSYAYYRNGNNPNGTNACIPIQGGLMKFTAIGTLAILSLRVGDAGGCNSIVGQSQLVIEKIK